MKVNKTSKLGISLIKNFESCKLTAYPDSKNIFTAGWGCIRIDGRPVVKGDVITQEKADAMLVEELSAFEKRLNTMLETNVITQSNFDSLISFSFNLGSGALGKSTLLKKVLKDPNDVSIKDEFIKWINPGSDFSKGLLIRRLSEAHLYFTGALKYDFEAEALKILGKKK